jgi:hypothetical protein
MTFEVNSLVHDKPETGADHFDFEMLVAVILAEKMPRRSTSRLQLAHECIEVSLKSVPAMVGLPSRALLWKNGI